MTGSFLVPIIVPVVAFISLAAWLGMVFWADANPGWDKESTRRSPLRKAGRVIRGLYEKVLSASMVSMMSFFLIFGATAFLTGQWATFLSDGKPTPITWPYVLVGCIDVIIATGMVFWLMVSKARAWMVCVMFTLALLLLICIFAQIYWNNGGKGNFNPPLSHLDAVYFALGTMTTGTGNISALTEQARAIQSAQIVCNLVLFVFGAGIVIARITK